MRGENTGIGYINKQHDIQFPAGETKMVTGVKQRLFFYLLLMLRFCFINRLRHLIGQKNINSKENG
jgi:hypothetical protein